MWLNTIFPFVTLTDRTSKRLAEWENNIEFQNMFMLYLNQLMNIFTFEGLPPTCNERFFKLNLILNGSACIVDDSELGFLTLRPSPVGNNLNIYGEYPEIIGTGWNGFTRTYKNYMYGSDNTDARCVICRDNYMNYPMIQYIISWARRTSDALRTIDVASRKYKTPYFISCDESQKTSVKKIIDDIDYNRDNIITNKSTTPNMFQVLNTNVKADVLQTLWNHYNNLEAEIRTIMGITSAVNQDKSERLLVDEVNANNEMASVNIRYRLEQYKLFCDTVNDLFGLNISVRVNVKEDKDVDRLQTDESVDKSLSDDTTTENDIV